MLDWLEISPIRLLSCYRLGVRMFAASTRMAAVALISTAIAAADSNWTVVRNSHFEVYSEAGKEQARAALLWFEQLRSFFEQSGIPLKDGAAVRVIGFASASEYNEYRVEPLADAYYTGTGTQDYIVMPSLAPSVFSVAAHEYAHVVLHKRGLELPVWLSEGLAEYFSTVRISVDGCQVGGPLVAHMQTLERQSWMPLAELLRVVPASSLRQDRSANRLLYAESWALANMLLLAPEYRARAEEFIATVNGGMDSAQALQQIYSKPLGAITRDLKVWVAGAKMRPVELPGVALTRGGGEEAELSSSAARNLTAGLLSYREALLAGEAGARPEEIRSALQRTLALQPDFDDARFQLALLESNAGEYAAAVEQFRAMRKVGPRRAFGYWIAMADALNHLGERDQARAAAEEAERHADTPEHARQARELAYEAETDLAVRLTHDASGQPQVVTVRVAHGAQDFNPFVEPGDQMRRVEGRLSEMECGGGKATGVAVETAEGLIKLQIEDSLRVLMRNAPAEFVCGPQGANKVAVEYAASQRGAAAAGIVRAIEFR